jgi:hypothetical protein
MSCLLIWFVSGANVSGTNVSGTNAQMCQTFQTTVLLNNQRGAALSSSIYSSMRDYSTSFVCFLHPSSGVQLKL